MSNSPWKARNPSRQRDFRNVERAGSAHLAGVSYTSPPHGLILSRLGVDTTAPSIGLPPPKVSCARATRLRTRRGIGAASHLSQGSALAVRRSGISISSGEVIDFAGPRKPPTGATRKK